MCCRSISLLPAVLLLLSYYGIKEANFAHIFFLIVANYLPVCVKRQATLRGPDRELLYPAGQPFTVITDEGPAETFVSDARGVLSTNGTQSCDTDTNVSGNATSHDSPRRPFTVISDEGPAEIAHRFRLSDARGVLSTNGPQSCEIVLERLQTAPHCWQDVIDRSASAMERVVSARRDHRTRSGLMSRTSWT